MPTSGGPLLNATPFFCAFESPTSVIAFRARLVLEQELQRELNQPWRLRRLNVVEGRRTDITIRQPEVRVVQDVEKLRPELERFVLGYPDILERREIPVLEGRSDRDVSSLRAELLDR